MDGIRNFGNGFGGFGAVSGRQGGNRGVSDRFERSDRPPAAGRSNGVANPPDAPPTGARHAAPIQSIAELDQATQSAASAIQNGTAPPPFRGSLRMAHVQALRASDADGDHDDSESGDRSSALQQDFKTLHADMKQLRTDMKSGADISNDLTKLQADYGTFQNDVKGTASAPPGGGTAAAPPPPPIASTTQPEVDAVAQSVTAAAPPPPPIASTTQPEVDDVEESDTAAAPPPPPIASTTQPEVDDVEESDTAAAPPPPPIASTTQPEVDDVAQSVTAAVGV